MAGSAQQLAVVVLAAGVGTRMKSERPKALHEIAGRPLLGYSLAGVAALEPDPVVVVVGTDGAEVEACFGGWGRFVRQAEPRGTGHAVLQAQEALADFRGDVLILYADLPLLRSQTLRALVEHKAAQAADLALLSAPVPLPGLVVRDTRGRVERIVEVTDASPEDLRIQEGNTGVYLLGSDLLWKALAQLDDRNQQGELYLTDIVGGAVAEGRRVEALLMEDPDEALGVNTRAELARAAAVVRRRTAERLMAQGVTIVDPDATYIDVDVEVGRDCVIEPGCQITGVSRLGRRVRVKAHSVIESSELADDVIVGPMARLRPGTRLGARARVGNFVEVKNSQLGEGAKADHLAYIGDADVGDGASFGCGAITVNYDWEDKHRTTVEDGATIGCNVNLVAPVRVERDAAVAAGSTVTRDVPAESLGVARAKQKNVRDWRKRRRKGKAGGPTQDDTE